MQNYEEGSNVSVIQFSDFPFKQKKNIVNVPDKFKLLDIEILKYVNILREEPKQAIPLLEEKLSAFQTRTNRGRQEKHAPK